MLGDGGPLVIPPYSSTRRRRRIDLDRPQGQASQTSSNMGKLKLVNPPRPDLERSDDGLFRMQDASNPPADAAVVVAAGMLEAATSMPSRPWST